MSDIALRAEGLGKRYRIGVRETPRNNLGQRIKGAFAAPFRYLREINRPAGEDESIWALRDVGFEIRRGEVLGVVGRNGAGKSTLLKILSRIVDPSEGWAEIHGRVGSLLEVGTGFHPELTGRENIYMNGAILGMKRVDIDRRFDEIVAFAEVGAFLDTPVKRYSSGMYVRLAFGVAAHLEPDILLVDEVLAVGDAQFQQKCLGKMNDVAQQGRTILFVSHNMAAVAGLCKRALVIERGHIHSSGTPSECIQSYLSLCAAPVGPSGIGEFEQRRGNGRLRFTDFHLEADDGRRLAHVVSGQTVRLVGTYTTSPNASLEDVRVAFVLYSSEGVRLTHLGSESATGRKLSGMPETGRIVCEIQRFPFRAGRYLVDLYCDRQHEVCDWIQHAAVFEVSDGDYYGTGIVSQHGSGFWFVDQTWRVE